MSKTTQRIQNTAAILLILSTLATTGCVAVLAGSAASSVAVAHDRRTAGTIIDDNNAEIKVTAMVHDNNIISTNSRIVPVSYNGVMLLVGQTPTEEMKAEAERLAKSLPNMSRVYNEIEVRDPVSLPVRNNDTWITTKVKSSLLVNTKLDTTRVKVVTENGRVYLMGLVNAKEEAGAVETARKVSGVKKVIKIFEYVQ